MPTFRTLRRAVTGVLFLIPFGAHAGECDYLAKIAQETAALYRNSGDNFHRGSAQNYQNAYNACVNTVRQRFPLQPTAGATQQNALAAFGAFVGVLGSLNTLESSRAHARPRAAEIERELDRQREQVRQQEDELRKILQAAQQRQRQEAERLAALQADERSRCATRNPFGNARGCPNSGIPSHSPFATSGTASSPGSPFSRVNSPAERSEPSVAEKLMYDSVNKVACPDGISKRCMADDWRRALASIADHNGNLANALRAARYTAPDVSRYLITVEQYERIGRGEISYEDVEVENVERFANDLMRRLDRELAEIPSDPEAERLVKSIKERRGG